ncbi:hypothetical protein [Bradyrhizobium shewense]|uniref:hypothetical protein n=1 Tax=Bradyrhizobium shewense TaxID=1761772 RepID=UPI0013F607F0|nr:hypothetical protein [Bradyrhizobium shewense]
MAASKLRSAAVSYTLGVLSFRQSEEAGCASSTPTRLLVLFQMPFAGDGGWWAAVAHTLGLFVLFYTLVARTGMLDDAYWRWSWWAAIGFSLVLLLCFTMLVSKTKEMGIKVLAGYISKAVVLTRSKLFLIVTYGRRLHLVFGVGVVFRILDAFLLFWALFAFVIVPVAKVRPRLVPFDWWVRFLVKTPKMEVC